MKPVLTKTVKIIKFVGVAAVLASVALVMGEKALSHRYRLEDKRAALEKENQRLAQDIRALERKATLLRTDAKTIEKAAKCRLGMARSNETVYMFTDKRRGARVSEE